MTRMTHRFRWHGSIIGATTIVATPAEWSAYPPAKGKHWNVTRVGRKVHATCILLPDTIKGVSGAYEYPPPAEPE
jgi:hypothetical protein